MRRLLLLELALCGAAAFLASPRAPPRSLIPPAAPYASFVASAAAGATVASETVIAPRRRRRRGGAPANSRFTMVDGLRDAHVEDLPRTKRWLLGLLRKSLKQMAAGAGVEASRLAVYDALVVRYGGAGSGQPVHRDYGELTLNVALNDGASYAMVIACCTRPR